MRAEKANGPSNFGRYPKLGRFSEPITAIRSRFTYSRVAEFTPRSNAPTPAVIALMSEEEALIYHTPEATIQEVKDPWEHTGIILENGRCFKEAYYVMNQAEKIMQGIVGFVFDAESKYFALRIPTGPVHIVLANSFLVLRKADINNKEAHAFLKGLFKTDPAGNILRVEAAVLGRKQPDKGKGYILVAPSEELIGPAFFKLAVKLTENFNCPKDLPISYYHAARDELSELWPFLIDNGIGSVDKEGKVIPGTLNDVIKKFAL